MSLKFVFSSFVLVKQLIVYGFFDYKNIHVFFYFFFTIVSFIQFNLIWFILPNLTFDLVRFDVSFTLFLFIYLFIYLFIHFFTCNCTWFLFSQCTCIYNPIYLRSAPWEYVLIELNLLSLLLDLSNWIWFVVAVAFATLIQMVVPSLVQFNLIQNTKPTWSTNLPKSPNLFLFSFHKCIISTCIQNLKKKPSQNFLSSLDCSI